MPQLVLALLVALVVSACQNKKIAWDKEGATPADFESDKFNCLKKMHESGFSDFTFVDAAGRGLGSSGPITSRYVKNCLVARGWTPSLVDR